MTFVEGPDAWCADEAIATDVGMRWDGVHVYKPGAKLIFDTIAPPSSRCDPLLSVRNRPGSGRFRRTEAAAARKLPGR